MNGADQLIVAVAEKLHGDATSTAARLEVIHRRMVHDLRTDLARCGEALAGFQYRNPPSWEEVEACLVRCRVAQFMLDQETGIS